MSPARRLEGSRNRVLGRVRNRVLGRRCTSMQSKSPIGGTGSADPTSSTDSTRAIYAIQKPRVAARAGVDCACVDFPHSGGSISQNLGNPKASPCFVLILNSTFLEGRSAPSCFVLIGKLTPAGPRVGHSYTSPHLECLSKNALDFSRTFFETPMGTEDYCMHCRTITSRPA